MKSAKEFITEKLDNLSLEYHNKFYCDLTKELQEVIWAMANQSYQDCVLRLIDSNYDRLKDKVVGRKE